MNSPLVFEIMLFIAKKSLFFLFVFISIQNHNYSKIQQIVNKKEW